MKDWTQWPPMGLPQYLNVDTDGCSVYATVDSLETQIFARTGQRVQISRRRLYQKSHTSPTQGNNEETVFPIAAQGFVLESSFPQTPGMTLAEFLVPPTPEQEVALQAEEAASLLKWDITFDFYKQLSDLTEAPLIDYVNTGEDLHFMVRMNATQDYDSEYHNGVIGLIPAHTYTHIEFHQIIIKPKTMPGQIGTQNYKGELRAVLKASTEVQWQAICAILGIDPNAPVEETVT